MSASRGAFTLPTSVTQPDVAAQGFSYCFVYLADCRGDKGDLGVRVYARAVYGSDGLGLD